LSRLYDNFKRELLAKNDFDFLTSVEVDQNLIDLSLDYVQPFRKIPQSFDQ